MQPDDTPESAPPQPDLKPPKKGVGFGMLAVVVLLVAVAAFVVGTRSGDVLARLLGSQNSNLPGQLDLSAVQDVYSELRDQFDGELDVKKLIDGAKKGLVDASGDPYTVYFTKEEAEQYLNDLDGKFSGIGAELGKENGSLLIVATIDDSPARTSGLLAKDIIVKVNDQDTTGWSIDKAVSEIRGEKGTTVKLGIVRGQELKEFSIVRDEIISPSVKYEVTADNIGIMRISRFGEADTVLLAGQAAKEFKDKGVKGVVLDLRGNGGGILEATQDVVGLWLKDKVVVQEKRGEQLLDTLSTVGDAPLEGIPTVVLIDNGTASASEIVAGALHDHKAAQLVGVKSFGKGSVQQFQEVGGGQLKVTVAKWYTPNGKNISKEGIEPDVLVEQSDADTAVGKDAQKDKAVELLK